MSGPESSGVPRPSQGELNKWEGILAEEGMGDLDEESAGVEEGVENKLNLLRDEIMRHYIERGEEYYEGAHLKTVERLKSEAGAMGVDPLYVEDVVTEEFVKDAEDFAGQIRVATNEMVRSLCESKPELIPQPERIQNQTLRSLRSKYRDVGKDILKMIVIHSVTAEVARLGGVH